MENGSSFPGGADPEIQAMAKITEILGGLEPTVQKRVLHWAANRYSVQIPSPSATSKEIDKSKDNDLAGNGADAEFKELPDLYTAAKPSTDAEKALIVGYWFQAIQGQNDLDAQQINTQLKHLGYGVTNITSALNDLINRKPQLVIQTHKSGKSKQARKKYKLTQEGIKLVKTMLAGQNQPPEE